MNNPHSTWNCSDPAKTYSPITDSWVEIYNPQNQPFNLYAAHTSLDSGPNTTSFHFPFGASIASHGYLVVFPNTYSGTLNAGGNLRLTIAGIEIDQLSIPALAADESYARIPDGSRDWQITTHPTIDTSNTSSTQVTKTSTPGSTYGSGTGNQGNGSGYTNTSPTIVSGKQPGWTTLQLPTSSTTTPGTPGAASAAPTSISPVISPSNQVSDMPRRILLTALVVALALSLFWCWKLFSST